MVTVVNNGTGTLGVTDLSVSGADAENFSEAADDPFTLAPGASRDLAVSHEPGADRTDTATLEIQHNDTDSDALVVDLTGNGTTGAAVYANDEGVIDTEGCGRPSTTGAAAPSGPNCCGRASTTGDPVNLSSSPPQLLNDQSDFTTAHSFGRFGGISTPVSGVRQAVLTTDHDLDHHNRSCKTRALHLARRAEHLLGLVTS